MLTINQFRVTEGSQLMKTLGPGTVVVTVVVVFKANYINPYWRGGRRRDWHCCVRFYGGTRAIPPLQKADHVIRGTLRPFFFYNNWASAVVIMDCMAVIDIMGSACERRQLRQSINLKLKFTFITTSIWRNQNFKSTPADGWLGVGWMWVDCVLDSIVYLSMVLEFDSLSCLSFCFLFDGAIVIHGCY